MVIRKVLKEDDFQAIGDIYANSWKVAYKGLVPQDYLDSLGGSRWSNILANSEYDAYVILDKEKYVGTSSIYAGRDENMEGWGEIVSIYLLPEYFGKGYGKLLFEFVIEALYYKGFRDIYLWTLEGNARAQKFYEKNGFYKSNDTKKAFIGNKEVTEIKYILHNKLNHE